MKHRTIVSSVIVLLCLGAGSLAAASEKYDTSLRFLRNLRETGAAKTKAERPACAAAAADRVAVTVKFDRALSDADIADIERLGASFFRLDGRVAHSGPFYTITLPWDALDELEGRIEVRRLAAAWRPAVYPLLDVSAHEIEADSAWKYIGHGGLPITGAGMRIADFDTGIDVFHPSFFYADGDTFDWIDRNSNGVYNSGVDAVDMNHDGIFQSTEILYHSDGWIYDPAYTWSGSNPGNVGNGFQAYWDWLWNDTNYNGKRDMGTSAGYSDATPGFGEPVFTVIDSDGDGALDVGEKLVQLGTSKVYATMGTGGTERIRGSGVINSDLDSNGHGTAVSGILAGATVDRHLFTGIAPDAEVLAGYYFSGNPISSLIPWARSRGADVMLYEFGGFVWDFLDGSSLDEELITAMNDTVIQITPSGNLGRGNKHAIATVAGNDSLPLLFTAVAYGSSLSEIYYTTLWRTSQSDLTFRLKSPYGGMVTLSGGVSAVDGFYIWFERATSPRGTCALNLYIERNTRPDVHGTWEVRVVNKTASPIETIDNVADDVSSWAGGAEFIVYATDQRNVTWPATADRAFVNGSYSTRGYEGYGGVGGGSIEPGEISAFSGRGERIDGLHLLDICSPGNYDVYSTKSRSDGGGYPNGSYRQFSGTSAAGPHVAAAAALVQQAFPTATMAEVAYLITTHAATDRFTGSVYNDTWGWGKLRILGAIGVWTGIEEIESGARPPALMLGQNYPNPFNPTTWIPFYLQRSGQASVRIYNVKGELVKVLKDAWLPKGEHSVRWSGDDAKGHRAASGVYLCVLRFGGMEQSRKLMLLR